MKSMNVRATCLILCFGASLACEKAEPPSAPEPAAATAAPSVPAPSAVPTAVAVPESVEVAAVPAREDFEEEAERAITPTNLEQQLEALEREVSAE